MASRTRSSSRSNHRASLAVISGLLGVLAVPVAVAVARQTASVDLIDAVWAIPFAAAFSIAALLFARGARGRIRERLERVGGAGRARVSRWLAVAGISLTLSASIAIGFYELLLRLEQ
jgi:hypothetical protein